jgi:paraquat-inducible protein B
LFTLFETYERARDDRYTLKRDAIVEFHESVRGLSVGAPVEFQGLKIGEVLDIGLVMDFDKLEFTIPVRVRVEPERLPLPIAEGQSQKEREHRLIGKGFRAQLETGSLLTGQLFINLDFHADAPPVEPRYQNGLLVVPSVPSSSRAIMQSVMRFVKRLDELPVEDIGRDLQGTLAGMERLVNGPDLSAAVASLKRIMVGLETTTQTLNAETVPELSAVLAEMQTVLKDLDQWVSADAPLQADLRQTLEALSAAARAVSELADMLERHPEALFQGKEGEGR